MDAKTIIRDAVAQVATLRHEARNQPGLAQAVADIKHLQARRFSGTYADLLQSAHYKSAATFFLDELYSDKDFTERDAQFARIAGALERVFPEQVVHTAVALAQLHRLTEELDLAMARHWLKAPPASEVTRYIAAWRAVGRSDDRRRQLHTTLEVGQELDRLTRKPGLRMMLRMMRGTANLAGLGSLQKFLEAGFDTFAAMGAKAGATEYFLSLVDARESLLIHQLFDAPMAAFEADMTCLLEHV